MTGAAVIDLGPQISTALASDHGLHRVGTGRILIGPGALDRLAIEVAAAAAGGPVVVLEDASPMRRGDDDLKGLVEGMLRAVGPVARTVLGPPDGSLHADPATLTAAGLAVAGAACVVTVGSGTLTDVGKLAAGSRIPLVAVQTAASVNGYADDMSVILKEGVKRTVPSAWPSVLIIDTLVIRDAPAALTASGYGEMLAMFTAPADWRLASLLGFDGSYSETVVAAFRPRGEELLAAAAGVAGGEGVALDLLSELLTTSGAAMGAAGRTAPLSGTEHLISHLLDMSAASVGSDVGLHGSQVGVSAIVAACMWEHVLDRLDPASLTAEEAFPGADAMEVKVRGAFDRIDSSGAVGDECWADYSQKLATWNAQRDHLREVAADWHPVRAELKKLTGDPEAMADALRRAGAPTRFSDLQPSIEPDRVRWAVASCHLMRNRFTVADLASFLGLWEQEDVTAVLARAASVGGGL